MERVPFEEPFEPRTYFEGDLLSLLGLPKIGDVDEDLLGNQNNEVRE